jgi:hypothetical protein
MALPAPSALRNTTHGLLKAAFGSPAAGLKR